MSQQAATVAISGRGKGGTGDSWTSKRRRPDEDDEDLMERARELSEKARKLCQKFLLLAQKFKKKNLKLEQQATQDKRELERELEERNAQITTLQADCSAAGWCECRSGCLS